MSRLRLAVAAVSVVLAFSSAPFLRSADTSSGSDEEPGRQTITTVLYPGWNLVGWVGPDTPTSELFEAIPALWQVWTWDAESQAYVHGTRDSYDDLPSLSRGMGGHPRGVRDGPPVLREPLRGGGDRVHDLRRA